MRTPAPLDLPDLLVDCKERLLGLSDASLDAAMFPLIEKWGTPPRAIEILEVLDLCIYGSLSSDIVIVYLQYIYDVVLIRENLKHEDLVPLATWRLKR